MVKLTLTLKGLDEMQAKLEKLSKKGLAAASRESLTELAREGRLIWQRKLQETSEIRNAFTLSRVLYVPARGTTMKGMEARLGHPAQYVRDLEFGTTQQPKGSTHAVGIPELAARGGDSKKVVGRANMLGTIGKLAQRRKGATFKARNAAALMQAKRRGEKLVLLEGPNSKGIFRFKNEGRKQLRVKKIWDLSHRTASRPKRPTLQATLDEVIKLAPGIAEKAMEKQLAIIMGKS